MPRRPDVVFQPRTHEAIVRGVSQVVRVLRPTLGPIPRYVGVGNKGKKPELLDNAGLIARRIVELADPDEDVGAMYMRSLLWRMHEEIGDGTATTAILFGAIVQASLRYIAAGGNAMILREKLTSWLDDIVATLDSQAKQVEEPAHIRGLALSLCHDDELAELLTEAFQTSGAEGRIEVRKGRGRESFVEYVPGSYWESGLAPNQVFKEHTAKLIRLHNPHILISDLELDEPQDLGSLIPLLELKKIGPLAIVASRFSEKVLGVLNFINRYKGSVHVIALSIPEPTDALARKNALDDLGLLTGGRLFLNAAGSTFTTLTVDDFGMARQLWADDAFYGIVGGKGDPLQIHARLQGLRNAYDSEHDVDDRQKLLNQISLLLGGTANIVVGGVTERDIDRRTELVERAVRPLRLAIRNGMLPGGGIALLNCRRALFDNKTSSDSDDRAVCEILAHALEAPLRTLLCNAGLEWAAVMSELQQAQTSFGCDVLSGQILDMYDAGILDIASVTKASVCRAVQSAGLLLTVDTLVHHRNPQEVFNPR